MDLKECRQLIVDNTISAMDGPVIVGWESLVDIIDSIDSYDDLTKSMQTEFIQDTVSKWQHHNKELELLMIDEQFVLSMKEWLANLESKIEKLKASPNNTNVNDLKHLYFHRRNLKELLKFL